ncbi:uncharacterized protein EI90DRAFT_3058229 [Cantharellus anzutake]|uniref:uncharacterized protein n=1 Tax=Cantharellus anzutake TaxID=1750568 RepID=UPI001903E782|nr:uncharacterized protein EI90DRAFT_3058229 [Cantharellus anzutake]KAF8331022.1 hypothetical protein EI90DRAFT_3058229 [Cantharellus anzutake]
MYSEQMVHQRNQHRKLCTTKLSMVHEGEGDAMYMQVMVQDIVLGTPNCPKTHAEEPPWCEAVLVTACHAVRTQWNEFALRLHCRGIETVLYQFLAEDTTEGWELRLSKPQKSRPRIFLASCP